MNETIYGIFSGAYSDWQIHGYMTDRNEAEKYCALKNKENDDEWGRYYVIDINNIYADVKDVKLKYYHEVVFDFNKGMRNEPDRYEYYIGEDKKPTNRCNIFRHGDGWICFCLNADSREKAEKIAQDKYYQFLAYKSDFGIDKTIELLGINMLS